MSIYQNNQRILFHVKLWVRHAKVADVLIRMLLRIELRNVLRNLRFTIGIHIKFVQKFWRQEIDDVNLTACSCNYEEIRQICFMNEHYGFVIKEFQALCTNKCSCFLIRNLHLLTHWIKLVGLFIGSILPKSFGKRMRLNELVIHFIKFGILEVLA